MYAIYGIFKNYGVALAIFALLTKLLLLPTGMKSQRNTAKMRAVAPKVAALKKQFANNQQRFQQEQQKLYTDEGINQMAGCLPLLIQFPILFGIIDVVYKPLTHILRLSKDSITKATEIVNEYNLAHEITDKALGTRPEIALVRYAKEQPELFTSVEGFDKIADFNSKLFGFIDLGQTPNLKPEIWDAAAIAMIVLPVMAGLIMIIQQIVSQIQMKKQNAGTQNMGCMNVVLYGSSAFYIWIMMSVPVGASFYWTVSGLFGLVQMILLNKYYSLDRAEKILAADKEKMKDKPPGFMQRMMEKQQAMLAEQNGTAPSGSSARVIQRAGEEELSKMSKSELQEYNRKLINEARRRQAEKYGEEYKEENIDDE